MPIDADAAAIVARDPDGVEAEAFGIGHAPDRDQGGVGLDLLGGAAGGRLDRRLEPRAR